MNSDARNAVNNCKATDFNKTNAQFRFSQCSDRERGLSYQVI